MKILHIYEQWHPPAKLSLYGGIYGIMLSLSKHLVKKGHLVTVLLRWYEEREENVEGVRLIKFKSRKIADQPYKEIKRPCGPLRLFLDYFFVSIKVRKFLNKHEFDVIHLHFPFSSSILVNLNKRLRDKMVYTVHIGEEKKRFALDSSAPLALKLFSPDQYLMKRVRKSVVLNEPLKEKLVEKGIEEEKLEVIPNGVNVEDFNVSEEEIEMVKKKYGLEGITVMFAGTVTPRKGVLQLIRAGEILKLGKEVLFLIVGNLDLDKGYAEKVMEYAKSKGINAKFTGFIRYEDLKALYSACDIFVLPSFEEGHGIVLTEAMASGKPLIGSNVGGISAQIRNGWNGFLIEPGNEKQLAEKIRYLIDNPEERERMGRNSRKLAREEFDWKKIAEKYLKVYEEVAE